MLLRTLPGAASRSHFSHFEKPLMDTQGLTCNRLTPASAGPCPPKVHVPGWSLKYCGKWTAPDALDSPARKKLVLPGDPNSTLRGHRAGPFPSRCSQMRHSRRYHRGVLRLPLTGLPSLSPEGLARGWAPPPERVEPGGARAPGALSPAGFSLSLSPAVGAWAFPQEAKKENPHQRKTWSLACSECEIHLFLLPS